MKGYTMYMTCDINSNCFLLVHKLLSRHSVPSDVPSYQDHRAVLVTHGNHVHILMGSNCHHLGGMG